MNEVQSFEIVDHGKKHDRPADLPHYTVMETIKVDGKVVALYRKRFERIDRAQAHIDAKKK